MNADHVQESQASPPPAIPQQPPPPPPPVVVQAPPPVVMQVQQTPKTSGLAIASLVLGLLWIYGLGSLLAVIFGSVALRNISRSGGWVTGKGMAIAGLVLGIIGLVAFIAVVIAAAGSSSSAAISPPVWSR